MIKAVEFIELLGLVKARCYKEGDYTLSSGKKTNYYINCKPITLSGEGLYLLSMAMLNEIGQDVKAVAGLTLGADPLVAAVAMHSYQTWKPLDALIVRKEPKGHGTGAWIEGPLPEEGSKVTILEDVVTTGGSSLKAVEKIRDAGLVVERCVAIVDRQEGGEEALEKEGVQLISLYNLEDFHE